MVYKRGEHWHLDVTIAGVRYREALETTDKREAKARAAERIASIKQGRGASKTGREFARKPFREAAAVYLEERKPHVSARTTQFEGERLNPLTKHFGDVPVLRIGAADIARFQRARLEAGVANRTVNMETGVLRRVLKRAKTWSAVAEDVRMLPENQETVGRALPADLKRRLFETAASKPGWMVAHCAAVLAASTTCRGVELRGLRWKDVDLFGRVMVVRRSKTTAGHRTIPLNSDAMAALARLLERARAFGAAEPEHFVFASCEHRLDGTKGQKGWRTAWRKLVRQAGRDAGREAAREVLEAVGGLRAAIAAYRRAMAEFRGLRFHDLRHQAITELAEGGASDAILMALSGHLSKRMIEHYSHVRMAAKREALDKLAGGLMGPERVAPEASKAVN
jgi:integrase